MDKLAGSNRLLLTQAISKLFFCPVRCAGKPATSMGSRRFRELPVESDPEKLVNYVCGANYFMEGSDPKIRDDSEYPEWIWKIKIDALPRPDDYDPKTKRYWELTELHHMKRYRDLKAVRPKMMMMFDEYVNKSYDRLLRLRERAIIPEAIDHGYDPKEVENDPIDPRIYLEPVESTKVIPLDQLKPPPDFSNMQHYKNSVKKSLGSHTQDELYSRYRYYFPKWIPVVRRWNK